MFKAPTTHAAALGTILLAGLSTSALAHDTPASTEGIDEAQAKRVAERFLRGLGYTRPRISAITQRILDAKRVGDTWHVNVRIGGTLPTERAIVLVDAQTGEVLDG